MIEEFVGLIFRPLFRVIVWIFFELVFELAFYVIGYPVVKLLTFGKYPKKFAQDVLQKNEYLQDFCVSLVGFLVSVLVLFYLTEKI